MRCEEIQKRLKAFLSNDTEDQMRDEIRDHLKECPKCARELRQIERLSELFQTWEGIEPPARLYERLKSRLNSPESLWARVFTVTFIRKAAFRFAEVAAVVFLTLLVSGMLRKPEPMKTTGIGKINVYLTEHKGAALQTISDELGPQPEARVSVRPEDILYYEHIEGFSRYARPGVILKGTPKSHGKIHVLESPSVARGKTLELPQARKAVDFEPAAPLRLHPGYILDSIRKIEDYSSLHLIYTNGIDTISLFEQSLDGRPGLTAEDFREYAVYRGFEPSSSAEKTPDKATILAWSNGAVSFVLIGKIDLARMVDMAQSVSTVKKNYE